MIKLFKLFAVIGLFAVSAISLNSDAHANDTNIFRAKAKVDFVSAEESGLLEILKSEVHVGDKPAA